MFMSLRERRTLSADLDLLPSGAGLRREGVPDIEAWIAAGREWRVALAILGRLSPSDWLLEIGAGFGRNAFALRDVFSTSGHYHGMGQDQAVATHLEETFAARFPRFRFSHAASWSGGGTAERGFSLPFKFSDATYRLIFSTEAFTRLPPTELVPLLAECARILKPGGRLLAAMQLLDGIEPGRRRPPRFASAEFEFGKPTDGVAIAPGRPRGRVAFTADRLASLAAEAGLELAGAPMPGRWSGAAPGVVDLDLVVLQKSR